MNNKKTRKKRSKIWGMPQDKFKELIYNSKSFKDVMRHFGMRSHGGNHNTLKARLKELNIDTNHFITANQASNLARVMTLEKLSHEVLVENSSFGRYNLKKYLVKFKLLDYKCQKCLNTGEWMGEPMTLQLEHKNGVNDDNRLENLSFLCPNCHSQTSTFAGKQLKNNYYCQCGKEILKGSKSCHKCRGSKQTKIEWPEPDALQKLLWEKPTSQIAKELGVSDVAVAKFCKKHGVQKPPRGYWAKQNKG